jgi:hypothetical protein
VLVRPPSAVSLSPLPPRAGTFTLLGSIGDDVLGRVLIVLVVVADASDPAAVAAGVVVGGGFFKFARWGSVGFVDGTAVDRGALAGA